MHDTVLSGSYSSVRCRRLLVVVSIVPLSLLFVVVVLLFVVVVGVGVVDLDRVCICVFARVVQHVHRQRHGRGGRVRASELTPVNQQSLRPPEIRVFLTFLSWLTVFMVKSDEICVISANFAMVVDEKNFSFEIFSKTSATVPTAETVQNHFRLGGYRDVKLIESLVIFSLDAFSACFFASLSLQS